ncbi:tetratricopeptide repeat protein [Alphaproteobacteria bacterium]|nr:tetratricopeptide repeat protein [Alphaproteobacteria bacterium]
MSVEEEQGSLQLNLLKSELVTLQTEGLHGYASSDELNQAVLELKRRLLKLSRKKELRVTGLRTDTNDVWAKVVLGAGFVLAFGVFLLAASPLLSDMPLAKRLDVKLAKAKTDKDVSEVRLLLEKQMATGKSTGQDHFLLGSVFRRQGRFVESQQQFSLSFEKDYAPFQSQMMIGEAAISENNGYINERAQLAFEKAAVLEPNNPRLEFYRGAVVAQDGDFEQAISIWTELQKRTENSALLQQITQNISSAERVLSSASEQPGPTSEDIAAAESMDENDRQAMIQSMVNRLAGKLAEDPSDIEGWMRLARSYLVLEQHENAELALESLLEQEENHSFALFMLGRLKLGNGQPAEAKVLWEKVLKQIPTDRPEYQTLKKQIDALGI